MKTIGLIGGMGWESSKLYYERINIKVNAALGGSHSAKIIMISLDFAEIESLTFKGDWKAIGHIVAHSAKQLERAGADMVVLCTNLIHIVSAQIEKNISIPFLHIADATGAAIRSQDVKNVLLLGTKPTMENDFYTKILRESYGLNVVIPTENDRNTIHTIIYSELLKGIVTDASKSTILKIISKANSYDIEGVILGCTELPMLIDVSDVTIPIFDTAHIHVDNIIREVL